MNLKEYAEHDGIALAVLVKKGEVTPGELALLANSAIDELNPTLNFMAHRVSDADMNVDDTGLNGAFYGNPFLIKEGCAAVKDQPWNIASRLGVGRTAQADDELTTRFRQAGLSIIGQSTAPEAGNAPTTESLLHGPTRNPWNPDYMSGGSSGGSAAAVAAGVVPMAHASDGAGSIRIPAACCGLVGLKPTRARTPCNHGAILSLTSSHILSRTLRDSALMLDCIQGPEVGGIYLANPPERPYLDEVSRIPKPLKIGFTTLSPSGASVDPDCINGVEKAAKTCESLGHCVEEAELAYNWEALMNAFVDLYSSSHPYGVELLEQASSLRSGLSTRETCNLAMLAHAKQLTMLEFTRHINELMVICRQVGNFFTQYDVLITPVMNRPALPIGEMNANAPDLTAPLWFERQFTDYASFTPVYNATGQPAMSLPLHHSDDGLPIGVQFAARHGDEATLFQLGGQLEQAMPWQNRKPPISIF